MTSRSATAFGIALSLSALVQLLPSERLGAQAAPVSRTTSSALAWGPCPALFPKGCEIAVLNGDPSKPNSDVFLRVPGGYKIPPHSHSSAERMVLVEGQLTVTYKGAAPSALKPGTYAYGPASMPHDAKCASAKPCTLFIAFEGPVDAAAFVGSLK